MLERIVWALYTQVLILGVSTGFLFSTTVSTAHGQNCGDVVIPAGFYYESFEEQRSPIENCDNPFNADRAVNFTASLKIDDQAVEEGSSITLATTTGTKINFIINVNSFNPPLNIFQKIGSDYVLKYEADTGENTITKFKAGTYVATYVYTEPPRLNQSNPSWWQKLHNTFFGTAYAYYEDWQVVQVVNFEIVIARPEPIGASSVLFLPGIQASRLYTQDYGEENRLWEPNINTDVEKLVLDENGVSINHIYTRDVLDAIFGVSDVYRTFIKIIRNLKDDEKIIKDFSVFAYDWRYSVEDIVTNGVQYENEVKYLIAEVERLANNSYTDKVSIIAHSNGGLVGKSLLSELQKQGKAELVDKFVMIGTPQLGTPKAIGVMLHGMGQQVSAGLIVNDKTARDVIKNMPGAYSLLPSPKYFEKNSGPVITFDNSNATAQIRTYGQIDSASILKSFLLDTNNTREENPKKINQPSVLNTNLFTKHEQVQSRLDSWRAPESVAVYEVVGTGISTIRGIEYRAFPCVAVICAFGFQMKPYPLFSDKGDKTVLALSASGYGGDKITAKVDLVREGAQFTVRERQHSNLTESPTVKEFINSIIKFPYVSETLVVPPNFVEITRKYTLIGAHSPVTLSVEDTNGLKVGREGNVVNEEIPGSQFIELGGSTYILLPADTNYTATIEGTGNGVYSLTIDSLTGDHQTPKFSYIGASTSPLMRATFTASSSGFSNIKTDSNGDGQIDLEQTLNGGVIVPEVIYTYADLRKAVASLTLPRVAKHLLLLQVSLAERFSILAIKQSRQQWLEQNTLVGIEDTLQILEKKKLISVVERKNLQIIINHLK